MLLSRLRGAGHRAFFVGGCARDMALGIPPREYDITTGATPDEVARLFGHTIPVGASFGVMLVIADGHRFEVATFRRDESYSDGRHPDAVTYSTSEEEDVLRRDFTINGMLYDPFSEEVIDYTEGLEDLKRRVIRTIGSPEERFTEDKLRLVRAVRFAARYGFEIEDETFQAIRSLADGITQVSGERIRDELVKIVSQRNPGAGLMLLSESGLLEYILPEAEAMRGVEQPPEFHPEGDVFVHTCLVLDKIYEHADGKVSTTLAMAGLLHDVAKPPTFTETDRIRFNGHDKLGAEMSREICRRLKFSNKEIDTICELVREHLKFKDVFHMRKSTLKRFVRMPDFEEHMALHRADCLASHGMLDAYDFVMEKLEEFRLADEEIKPAPLITGKDLIRMGYEPGPVFKEILSLVEEAQLEGEIKDPGEAENLVAGKYPLVR
ncbi:MAG: CCA tRNA nucleotidyltransferase [Candidatus Dadabacteria bacterium]|nr:CCA tRNA nucleotidyltransferase [Candidatus Dadabacteria bacterium]